MTTAQLKELRLLARPAIPRQRRMSTDEFYLKFIKPLEQRHKNLPKENVSGNMAKVRMEIWEQRKHG